MPQTTESPAPSPALTRQPLLDPYKFEGLIDDPRLTKLTDFAAALFEVPISLVSLVEDERQLFLARTGADLQETPRDVSFCNHAMHEREMLFVPDARLDPRFRDNPLVTGEPHIRFYAGAPLVGSSGLPLGSLCVIGSQPRESLSALQRQGLVVLAGAIVTLFEARRETLSIERETQEARDERDEREKRFAILADTMPQMVWSTRPDGFHDYYNARWYEFTGMPPGSTDGQAWNGMFHVDDQERAWTKWRACLESGEPYEIEYRLRDRHGDYRWVLGRALPMRDSNGTIVRWFGTCTDIHDQKMALEQRELISHELSHRIKNIFSVISGLIGLSARMHPQLKPAADDLRDRVMALGKAHDFVRPHSERSRPQHAPSSLHGLLAGLLAPYCAGQPDRVSVTGLDPSIDDQSATPLALLFHELATNAAKYGAFSRDNGHVAIDISTKGDRTQVRWSEHGGPPVTKAETTDYGFGSKLISMSVEQQLGGTIDRRWKPEGLEVEVSIPTRVMRRSPGRA